MLRVSVIFIAISVLILTTVSIYIYKAAYGSEFVSGLSHPILGFDHLLAMLSVGILSAQMGGRSIWTVPTTFVLVMAAGGAMGMLGINFFFVETGIAISVVLLGSAIALGHFGTPVLAMLYVGLFAIFHGYAHGAEMPGAASPLYYAIGFMTGTAFIHVVGVFLGLTIMAYSRQFNFLRICGAVISGVGVYFLLAN